MKLLTLNAYLSKSGIGSRRTVVNLIKAGKVQVNNQIIKEPGHRINPAVDRIIYENNILRLPECTYILLNKPKGYITTVSDESGRKTVLDLVKESINQRLFPVGRLDRDTTGLLLLTNDGELTQKLTHPKFEIEKSYHVILDKEVPAQDIERIKKGLKLYDGFIKADKIFYCPDKRKNNVMIKLHSGKNRIVRRIFEYCGYRVTSLEITKFAGLNKIGLRIGQWRKLTAEEIEKLKAI